MKMRYFSPIILLIIFVHNSHQQNFNPLASLSSVGGLLRNGSTDSTETVNSNGSTNSNGLVNTIRNTTSNLFSRLETPRDRVIEFIKPAVKSDLSRNITNVLNSIWNRLQGSNISLIQNPYVRTSIVRPINITLERLTQITAAEDEHAELNESNLEIINLDTPEEEQQFREYLTSSASTEDSNPILLLITENETYAGELNRDELKNDNLLTIPLNNDNKLIENKQSSNEENQLNNNQIIGKENGTDNEKQSSNTLNRRAARFMDSYTMVQSPERMRNFFDRVQEQRMRECLGLAICESNCSPHLYGGEQGFFRRTFDRFQSSNLDHQDYDYYVDAGRHGQRYGGGYRNDCRYCHRRYNCPHERQHLINSFSRMGNFY